MTRIGENHAVRVAVKRHADVGAVFLHQLRDHQGMQRPALGVDVEPVGRNAGFDDRSPEFPENPRPDVVGRTVGAVQHHFEPAEFFVADGALGEFDVAAARVVQPIGLAELIAADVVRIQIGFENQPRDLRLRLIFQFVAEGAEDLDAVVVVRIVGSRQHDAHIGGQRTREMGNGRRGNGSHQKHIAARRDKSAGDGGFQHVAGKTRVFADHGACAPIAVRVKLLAQRLAQPQRQLGIHRISIGLTTNAIRSKQFLHDSPLLSLDAT